LTTVAENPLPPVAVLMASRSAVMVFVPPSVTLKVSPSTVKESVPVPRSADGATAALWRFCAVASDSTSML
jgi:hypothetical protein